MTPHPADPAGILTRLWTRFAEAPGTSPLEQRTARALLTSPAALRALEALPPRGRRPALVLAALHDLALSGPAPALAAAGEHALTTLLDRTDDVAATVTRRRPATIETPRCAVLHPAVAEVARRAGAHAVGLIGLGSPADLDVHLDRIGSRYDTGQSLGDPSSAVQLTASVVGPGRFPTRALPEVLARVRVGRDLLDATDPDDARWLRACVAPDRPEEATRLTAALAVAATALVHLLRGDPVDLLSEAVARVPAGALPVVLTTWALSRSTPERRLRLRQRLAEVGAARPVAWVSVEGVGVAPGVPTLGDRPASGHSTVGLTLADGTGLRTDVVGRCWSRGRQLSWLAA